MVSLAVAATVINIYFPNMLPPMMQAFDAVHNSRKLLQEVKDEDSRRLMFLNGQRLSYFVLCAITHIGITSGGENVITHGMRHATTCTLLTKWKL